MDEDDLVSYRQYTINTTGGNRGGKKRPASPPLRTTTNQFDMDEDDISINPKQQVSWFLILIKIYSIKSTIYRWISTIRRYYG
jgi:hypothetical protein